MSKSCTNFCFIFIPFFFLSWFLLLFPFQTNTYTLFYLLRWMLNEYTYMICAGRVLIKSQNMNKSAAAAAVAVFDFYFAFQFEICYFCCYFCVYGGYTLSFFLFIFHLCFIFNLELECFFSSFIRGQMNKTRQIIISLMVGSARDTYNFLQYVNIVIFVFFFR